MRVTSGFRFQGSYAGKSLPAGKRSLLLRARIGDPLRTLTDEDIKGFSQSFETFLENCGLEIRRYLGLLATKAPRQEEKR